VLLYTSFFGCFVALFWKYLSLMW